MNTLPATVKGRVSAIGNSSGTTARCSAGVLCYAGDVSVPVAEDLRDVSISVPWDAPVASGGNTRSETRGKRKP